MKMALRLLVALVLVANGSCNRFQEAWVMNCEHTVRGPGVQCSRSLRPGGRSACSLFRLPHASGVSRGGAGMRQACRLAEPEIAQKIVRPGGGVCSGNAGRFC